MIPGIYRNVPDIYESEGKMEIGTMNYTLIVRADEDEYEILLNGANCGYGGSGSSATTQILQV